MKPIDLQDWPRQQCAKFVFRPQGVYVATGKHDWPLVASDADDLTAKLDAGGHLVSLPKERPTIQAQPGPNIGPFHWDSRRLRVPELSRPFAFPDDFDLVGRRHSVQAQIGNSVPPLLAERVVEQIAKAQT